jgi:hypothetical protein
MPWRKDSLRTGIRQETFRKTKRSIDKSPTGEIRDKGKISALKPSPTPAQASRNESAPSPTKQAAGFSKFLNGVLHLKPIPSNLTKIEEQCARVVSEELDAARKDFELNCKKYTKEMYLEGNVVEMTDNEETRLHIKENLESPDFSKENFIEIAESPTKPETFVAIFKKGEVELSNRAATNGEFRAERLKNLFKTGDYRNLRDLCTTGFLTENDAYLFGFARAIKGNLENRIEREVGSAKFLRSDNIQQTLKTFKIGDTNLKTLFAKLRKH